MADLPGFTAFTQDVEDALDSAGVLRYAQRQRLMRRADHFGLRRFDANLLIAMVQSRVQEQRRRERPRSARSPHVPVVVTFLVTQSLIVAGAWWVLAR
jgi:hypothetical protein